MAISAWQALRWNYVGNLTRGLTQFLVGVLLARLLGPEPFGVVALAWMIVGLGRLVADLGFGATLVQKAALSDIELRFIFTVQMAFALLLTVLGWMSSDAIASYYGQPNAAQVLRALFCLFLIDCPGQTAAAMLRRALNFKKVQQIGIASYLAGYLMIGLPCALLGLGVWSLVAAQLTQSVLCTVLLLRGAPVPLRPSLRCETSDIASFGLKVTAANLSSWAISNLDTAFVGRTFGISALGLYSRALSLLNMPMSMIVTGFQGVLFAACSRHQDDLPRVRCIYLETSAAVALVCVPLFATAAAIPRTLMVGVYGSGWESAVPLVTPLALAILVNALLAIQGPILMAGNRVGAELRNQACTALVFIPALWLASKYTLVFTAWTVLATYILRWMLLTASTLRLTGARLQDYVCSLRFPTLFGMAVAGLAALADSALAPLPPFPRLLAVAGVAALASLVLAQHFGARFLTKNMSSLVNIERLAPPVRRFLNI